MTDKRDTSWQKVGKWYGKVVGEEGHYYHQHVIFPNLLRLIKLNKSQKLLDLACGQGVLARAIPPEVTYYGLDAAAQLINEAKSRDNNNHHHFVVADITKPFTLPEQFDVVTIILALQNTAHPFKVIANAKNNLKVGGRLIMVLNHPAFRIPQYSNWQVDAEKQVQYRRIGAYLKPKVIGITAHPGKANSEETVSYHYPISSLVEFVHDNRMVVVSMEEWVSDKKSTGIKAAMEDTAREEIPLFMMIECQKIP
ncbi:class I SAM-dependent methyltransferase [Patescibacteria group bacterium]|nr:class I SAM-dependent methyltransferase [Patescibacteria group bacterium]